MTYLYDLNHPAENIAILHGCPIMILFPSHTLIHPAGNSLILMALITDRQLQNRSNKFIKNLAFADFLVGAWTMSVTFASMLHGKWVCFILCPYFYQAKLVRLFWNQSSGGLYKSSRSRKMPSKRCKKEVNCFLTWYENDWSDKEKLESLYLILCRLSVQELYYTTLLLNVSIAQHFRRVW